MEKWLGKRFWAALFIFGLMGQVAWVVENMYFNVFIYKMFHASAADISLMVGASSVAAAITTIFVGAFTDYMGKRKVFICGGYIAWGISILVFAFIRVDLLTPIAGGALQAAALGITLVIVMDCVMTFLGSSANDACFNAWMTDWGDGSNRGKIEGINSMMPLVAILVVFGGFAAFDLERAESWTTIYLIVGLTVLLIGILGIFLIEESRKVLGTGTGAEESRKVPGTGTGAFQEKNEVGVDEEEGITGGMEKGGNHSYAANLVYSFRLRVMKENPLLYAVLGAFAVFGISINIFMPYLILYYEKTLGMENYVMIMAPAIVLAAVVTAFYGKLFDLLGFQASVVPCIVFLCAGYVILYVGTGTGIVFVGSLLMMTGYLTGMAVFGAMIRSHIPEEKAGQFQGIRIIGQVLIPGIIGPAAGAAVLRNAEQVINSDGTTSFLPNRNIYMAALVVAVLLLVILRYIFGMMRKGHYRLISQAGEMLLREFQGSNGGALANKDTGLWSRKEGGNDTLPEEDLGEGSGDVRKGADVWGNYPRPRMRRESFYSLNGNWSLNGQKILVPFPPQSFLSGYEGHVGAVLEYKREFAMPVDWKGGRVLLHFGAVDQVAEVFLNGHFAGGHEGGYMPFSMDITEYVREGINVLEVKAKDTLSHMYPYGKQRKNRGGMWYTPVSGIWQSVWMEHVPEVYIRKLDVTADMKKVRISVEKGGGISEREPAEKGGGISEREPVEKGGGISEREPVEKGGGKSEREPAEKGGKKSDIVPEGGIAGKAMLGAQMVGGEVACGIQVEITLHDGSIHLVQAEGAQVEVDLGAILLADGTKYQPMLWTLEQPYLYEMTVTLGEDKVSSYFGLRTVEIKEVDGMPRVCLNGEPVFLHGVLDQGYYCDGIYLPAEEEEYERDILRMKELGINLLRKHIKIEPECFYYFCDVHGMLVMQDMVNSGHYSWLKDTALPTIGICQKGKGTFLSQKRRRDFFVESMKETIAHLRGNPCVVAYTIFNEGWGQFDSDAMYELAKELDSTRLYDATSGWFHGKKSDFDSQHIYFKPLKLSPAPQMPVLVSECGGYSYGISGHVYSKYTRFGYGDCRDSRELTERIRQLYEETILPGIPKGVCGCVYTQLSDVEDETNGLYTYDRRVCKVEKAAIVELGKKAQEVLKEDTIRPR